MTDTPAYEIVTLLNKSEWDTGVWVTSLWASCSECVYTRFTTDLVENVHNRKEPYIADHLEQHGPGRALDIEVDWEISAWCTVCADGIGDIEVNDSETVQCQQCHTTWTIEGTDGELNDDD